MLRGGTTIVSTSNRAPSELYENGINRSEFLPFMLSSLDVKKGAR